MSLPKVHNFFMDSYDPNVLRDGENMLRLLSTINATAAANNATLAYVLLNKVREFYAVFIRIVN